MNPKVLQNIKDARTISSSQTWEEEFHITTPEKQSETNRKIADFENLELFKNISLRPQNIFIGNWKVATPALRTEKQIESEKHLREKKEHTELSKKAKKNLFNAMHWLEASASFTRLINKEDGSEYYMKTNFITLCIPSTTGELLPREEAEALTDFYEDDTKEAYSDFEQLEINSLLVDRKLFQKMLNGFLTNMRTRFALHNYVWKIEAQRNGQLHIHINTDTFIHYSDINNYWNAQLEKNGLLKNYEAKFGNVNPPSTDVHSIQNAHDAVGYVGKYMSKNPNFAKEYDGNIWGCSMGLKPSKRVTVKLQQKEFKTFGHELLKHQFEYKPCIHTNSITYEETKLGTIFFLKHKEWQKILHFEVSEAYKKHITFLKSSRSWMPREYYQLDMFAPETKRKYEEKKTEPEAIEPPEIFNPKQINIDFPF